MKKVASLVVVLVFIGFVCVGTAFAMENCEHVNLKEIRSEWEIEKVGAFATIVRFHLTLG